MIGIGVGGAEILPAMEAMDTVEVVAGADVVPTTLERFSERFPDAKTYGSAEALCADPDVDAVWVSSPNRFHAEHTILAARSGKHVVVEKPMAVTLADAARMVEAADKAGIKLLAGHTRAFTLPIRAMRKVIESGKYGELRALNIWSYSDWMLRPRTADELDLAQRPSPTTATATFWARSWCRGVKIGSVTRRPNGLRSDTNCVVGPARRPRKNKLCALAAIRSG